MSLVYLKNENDLTKIGIWKVEESIEELEDKLLLNEEELDFYHRLNKGKRNLHWLGGRVLLRYLLETEKFIEVRGDEHGKPHLVNFDYEISISHSYDYAAVAISSKRVGVDIEKIKGIIRKISHKFLNQDELAFLGENPPIENLYIIWCAKESLFKLNGKKYLSFRDEMKIYPFEYKGKGVVKGEIKSASFSSTFDISYEEFRGYMFTYVIEM